VFHIRLDEGQLAFGQSAGPKLVPLAHDHYRVGLNRRVSFSEAKDGSVDSIVVRVGPSRAPIVAKRLTVPPARPSRLADYAGRYYSAESDVTYDVRPAKDGKLEFLLERWGSFKVTPLSGDLFKDYFMADFARDRRGNSSGVYLSSDRSRRIWLRRIQ
jgi:hypothetical protein